MSVTNFITDERVTILQGVNGIQLCQESWMTEKMRSPEEQNTQKATLIVGETQSKLLGHSHRSKRQNHSLQNRLNQYEL